MSYEDVRTKEEAVSYVAAVMRSPVSLLSQSFKIAMDLSSRFEISVQEVLVYQRERVGGI
jgi:hypothetical protein